MLISIVFMLLGLMVSGRLKSKFTEYSQIRLRNGMSGAEVAQRMLHDNGIYDVRILQVEGQLTDHYDPMNKTVNLSYDVYHGTSAASAAVAAHECGHAVQHAVAYAPLKMRSSLVPLVNVATKGMNLVYGVYFFKKYSLSTIRIDIFSIGKCRYCFICLNYPSCRIRCQ